MYNEGRQRDSGGVVVDGQPHGTCHQVDHLDAERLELQPQDLGETYRALYAPERDTALAVSDAHALLLTTMPPWVDFIRRGLHVQVEQLPGFGNVEVCERQEVGDGEGFLDDYP